VQGQCRVIVCPICVDRLQRWRIVRVRGDAVAARRSSSRRVAKEPFMNVEQFGELIKPLAAAVAGSPLTPQLGEELDRRFPPDGAQFRAVEQACHAAIAAGWMCAQGGAGRRFGRVIEPGPRTAGLSVDVVDLTDIVGPHHRHPNGEVCMVMPVTPTARFDGKGAGWKVYPPGSAHHPTVTDGRALVLYMLPEGKIEFTPSG